MEVDDNLLPQINRTIAILKDLLFNALYKINNIDNWIIPGVSFTHSSITFPLCTINFKNENVKTNWSNILNCLSTYCQTLTTTRYTKQLNFICFLCNCITDLLTKSVTKILENNKLIQFNVRFIFQTHKSVKCMIKWTCLEELSLEGYEEYTVENKKLEIRSIKNIAHKYAKKRVIMQFVDKYSKYISLL